jgi:hypothetical protein
MTIDERWLYFITGSSSFLDMGIIEIAKRIKGGGCKRLVKQTRTEIEVTGASFDVGNFNIDVGKFSNKLKEFYKVTQTTIALDNAQLLLCETIAGLKDKPQLQEDCIRMRLQITYAFSQLQAILGSRSEAQVEELDEELTKWVSRMSKLNEDCIEILQPRPRNTESKRKDIANMMEYQGIDEKEMQEAVVNYEPSLQAQHKEVKALDENRKEEEKIPTLEFNGFIVTKGLAIQLGKRAGWIATTYSLRVKKAKGIGKAEECEGFVSLIDTGLTNMRSRWLPDDVVQPNIGGYMDLIVFQTIPIAKEIVFSPVSLQREMDQFPFRLEPHLDKLLSVEVHSKNAKTPKPLQKTVREIMDEAKPF